MYINIAAGSFLLYKWMSQFLLTNSIARQITYSGTKFSSRRIIKDKTKFKHQHDLVYLGNPLECNCTESYICETARRISERIIDHNGGNKHSHLFKHANQYRHTCVGENKFKALNKRLISSTMKRKCIKFKCTRKGNKS